ncbi:glycoside hydrolase family 16 protein [Aureitalea sp. L0-47]|uniref:glycoside hydrolase family 16 protein n=1 Tax=Aureitalea sp. L0-47 TaxID=2816962 RepID=UPI0022389269|nr:glycoside hydrolase family 16 protein [Aureitalea sp. L0-47]MCW5518517.1 glycoside hydrolase family 16 protein [Aureitalea sp. L0-47]
MKLKLRIAMALLCGVLLTAFWSCEKDDEIGFEASELRLVFEDNFDGAEGASINTDNWNFEIGNGENGWGNQELQYYTDRPENVSLDGEGNMVITARRESFAGFEFTSARITTKDKFEQKYGRWEARIKMPGGRGIWPAFWMLGANIETEPDNDPNTVPWPFVGEIDITELRGQEPSTTIGSIHGPGYSGGGAISGEYELEGERFDKDFYVFAIEWHPDYIDFFIDDIRFNQITIDDLPQGVEEWPFNENPFFMLMNIAVGGSFVGFPVEGTPFPQQMVVDYVRVYDIVD